MLLVFLALLANFFEDQSQQSTRNRAKSTRLFS